MDDTARRVAIITGASIGLGRELARALVSEGWNLVIDGRRSDLLRATADELSDMSERSAVAALAGDIADASHRSDLVQAALRLGEVRLVVNNASTLGASPMPAFAEAPTAVVRRTFEVNVVAPLSLIRDIESHLSPGAIVIDVTSDAAVSAYEGWGPYGASKAALDHASRVLAVERPDLRVLSVDPGDMRTEMHQAAFPTEDISDRPGPEVAVAGFITLINGNQPSGRYLASEVAMTEAPVGGPT